MEERDAAINKLMKEREDDMNRAQRERERDIEAISKDKEGFLEKKMSEWGEKVAKLEQSLRERCDYLTILCRKHI